VFDFGVIFMCSRRRLEAMDVFDFDEDDGQEVSSQTAEASVAPSPTGKTEASPAQNATQQTKPAPK
jgi:hypothetical protein